MLSSKVCIVTGGGRGLGRAAALELADLGATVVVNDLGTDVTGEGESTAPATATVEEIRDGGASAMAHFGDVTDLDYTESLVADTVEEYGRVDGVVNFAGVLRDSISYKMTEDEWDLVIDVHLKGHFSLFRNVAAHWRARAKESDDTMETQRSFLGVSSRAALGNVGQANYAAAKAGVLGLIRTGARELYRYNVRVNALMPTAYTRMIERIPEEHRTVGEELGPEKVAPMVAYLMSDDAEDVTGCTLRAAGDVIGVVSDPEEVRVGFKDGGWSTPDIAGRFRDDVADGIDLQRSEDPF